jgi:hypothetical protein
MRARNGKPRQWFWRFGRERRPIVAERAEDGFWRLTIGNCEIGVVPSREAPRR